MREPDLPLASILSTERIERAFRKDSNLFGTDRSYSAVVMHWSFQGQMLRDDKQASCQAAVAQIVAFKNPRSAVPISDSDTDSAHTWQELFAAPLSLLAN